MNTSSKQLSQEQTYQNGRITDPDIECNFPQPQNNFCNFVTGTRSGFTFFLSRDYILAKFPSKDPENPQDGDKIKYLIPSFTALNPTHFICNSNATYLLIVSSGQFTLFEFNPNDIISSNTQLPFHTFTPKFSSNSVEKLVGVCFLPSNPNILIAGYKSGIIQLYNVQNFKLIHEESTPFLITGLQICQDSEEVINHPMEPQGINYSPIEKQWRRFILSHSLFISTVSKNQTFIWQFGPILIPPYDFNFSSFSGLKNLSIINEINDFISTTPNEIYFPLPHKINLIQNNDHEPNSKNFKFLDQFSVSMGVIFILATQDIPELSNNNQTTLSISKSKDSLSEKHFEDAPYDSMVYSSILPLPQNPTEEISLLMAPLLAPHPCYSQEQKKKNNGPQMMIHKDDYIMVSNPDIFIVGHHYCYGVYAKSLRLKAAQCSLMGVGGAGGGFAVMYPGYIVKLSPLSNGIPRVDPTSNSKLLFEFIQPYYEDLALKVKNDLENVNMLDQNCQTPGQCSKAQNDNSQQASEENYLIGIQNFIKEIREKYL